MPSANTFADIFKTALAPVLSQLSSLNNNVTTVLQSGHEESDEDGETASVDEPANSGDMDADVSALLAAAGTDRNNEAMPGDELLKELAQDLTVSEKTSPPLREGLAAIFNNLLSEKMGEEKLKAKLDKYPRPENVQGLRTPKKGQSTLIGAITAMTKAADLALGKYSQDKELITLLTDSVAMALQYNHEVNHSRRLAMKKEMHKDYAALCNVSTVDGSSELLFGDLTKLAKDITEANKLTKKVRPQHSGNSRGHDKYGGRPAYGSQRRFQPYPRGKTSDFLGKSRFSKPPRKKKDGETSQRPQRGQSIHLLDLQHVTMEEDNYSFDLAEHIKTSTPRSPHTKIDISVYEPDSTI
ncbi:unnamed protein product, partial [Porites lobata]